jgi:hypothetical protein
LAGSCVVEDGALGDELPLEDELLAPPLGALGLAPLLGLGELELAPPEAEPDFALSLDDADPLMLPEGELEEDGLDGLEELGDDEVLLGLSPRSHAARPRASATATAIAESFMCPPRVGVLCKAANCAPGLNP